MDFLLIANLSDLVRQDVRVEEDVVLIGHRATGLPSTNHAYHLKETVLVRVVRDTDLTGYLPDNYAGYPDK